MCSIGIERRRERSEALDRAGAVFEDLYKKYLTVDNENLQKRAETYLLKSFYDKQTFKNLNSQIPGLSIADPQLNLAQENGPQELNLAQENGPQELNLAQENGPEELNLPSESQSAGHETVKSDTVTKDYVKQVSFETDHMKTGAKLVSKTPPKIPNTAKSNTISKPNPTSKPSPRAKSPNPRSKESIWGDESPNRILKTPQNSNTKPSTKLLSGRLKSRQLKLETNPRVQDKTVSKDDTRIFVDNVTESDISEESLTLENTGHLVTLKEYDHSPCFDKVEEFLTGSPNHVTELNSADFNAGELHGDDRRAILLRNKELNFICGLSVLFQIFMCFNVFGLFFLLHSFQFQFHSLFSSICLPFLLHFSMFYLVFTIGVSRVKKSLLTYTSDITVEILSKRLNRQMHYSRLSKFTVGAERIFVLLALVIACIPVKFSQDLTQMQVKESVYIAFNVVYALLQIAFCFYYFKVLFKKLLTLH
eukprot:XP_763064.1 hypothetical protein [Theileria parva strain Muguga]